MQPGTPEQSNMPTPCGSDLSHLWAWGPPYRLMNTWFQEARMGAFFCFIHGRPRWTYWISPQTVECKRSGYTEYHIEKAHKEHHSHMHCGGSHKDRA